MGDLLSANEQILQPKITPLLDPLYDAIAGSNGFPQEMFEVTISPILKTGKDPTKERSTPRVDKEGEHDCCPERLALQQEIQCLGCTWTGDTGKRLTRPLESTLREPGSAVSRPPSPGWCENGRCYC
ncbi:Hypothetical predicted protein [Pelobates cultripes]|uniref:Uncharacterized protein n=1 Tax=Pelobates cultripes TaxID=61616 RepID=A0AAD1W496_PELCU|nr:Hypothetical predicted protein [Pelobates cultripes]